MQEVLQNLMISAIEFRGEEDADVAPYRHATARELMVVEPSREVGHARAMLLSAFRHIMAELCRSKVTSLALAPVSSHSLAKVTPGQKSLPQR